MSLERYEPRELAALTDYLKKLEEVNQSPIYTYLLQVGVSIMLGKFYPQQIETLLREIEVNKYLASIPIEEIRNKIGDDFIAVLPQTGWTEYPYGLTVAFAPSRRVYERTLNQTQRISYDQNFELLAESGIALEKPFGADTTVIEFLREHSVFGSIRSVPKRGNHLRRRSGY